MLKKNIVVSVFFLLALPLFAADMKPAGDPAGEPLIDHIDDYHRKQKLNLDDFPKQPGPNMERGDLTELMKEGFKNMWQDYEKHEQKEETHWDPDIEINSEKK